MDERTLALRETGRRKVRRETICPAMTRSRFRTRTAQLRLFELVSLVHPRRASDTRDGLRTHADPVNAPRVRPHQLEEFRRARERRAECFAEGTPVQSAIVHRTRERREALAHARHHEKQRRAKARGVADLDTLRCFDDELRASEVVCGSPGASSEDDLRRQIEALRVGKRSAEAEASRLRGEVRHLEDLVDGLVKLLESAGEEPERTNGADDDAFERVGLGAVEARTPAVDARRVDVETANRHLDSAMDRRTRDRLEASDASYKHASSETPALSAWLENTVRLAAPAMAVATRKRNASVGRSSASLAGKENGSELVAGARASRADFETARLDFDACPSPGSPGALDEDVRAVLRSAEKFISAERERE